MIKTLKTKFVLINMLLVSAVLIAVFTAQCYTRYRQTQYESAMTLKMSLDRREGQGSQRFEVGKPPPPDFVRSPMFIAHIAPDGVFRLATEENVSVSEEQLAQIIVDVMETGKAEGVLSDWSLRYMLRSENGFTRIAFLDVSGDISSIRNTVLMSVLFCALSITAFFVKYSAENGMVTLALTPKQGNAVLTVHNLGNPLAPEDLEHLFERFYRADQSRSKEGYGLGLSIAQNIVKAHNGNISVESHPDRGTSFTVEIPLFGKLL